MIPFNKVFSIIILVGIFFFSFNSYHCLSAFLEDEISGGLRVSIKRQNEIQLGDGSNVTEDNIHNHLDEHEKIFLFGKPDRKPNVKLVQVTKNIPHSRKRRRRSTDGHHVTVTIEDNGEQLKLQLQRSPNLIDDAFILIHRYENSSQFIENSHKLASDYEKCFYRNENSALDLCDETIRGIFQHNLKDFLIHPLPERFGEKNHVIFEPGNIMNNNSNGDDVVDDNENEEKLMQKEREFSKKEKNVSSKQRNNNSTNKFSKNSRNEQETVNSNYHDNKEGNNNSAITKISSLLLPLTNFEPNLTDFSDASKALYVPPDVNKTIARINCASALLNLKQKEITSNNFTLKDANFILAKNRKDVIIKKTNNNNTFSNKNVNEIRVKRHISGQWKIPQILHIETAIFVDKDLFKHMARNFPKNTESHLIRFVLAMVNGVQLLYHHPSLGHQVNFVLKRLEILHNDPKDLRRSSDIDVFLNNFCLWQRKLNPSSDTDVVHYDHAVILTGLDLYVIGKNGKVSSQVVGLAPVAGMCTSTSSCTINEGKHFESVFVVAHEIGHNLGMRHDTIDNNCDPSLYIMSPTLGSGKITWSKCSRSYLDSFLETTQAQCLFDRGQFGNSLDHSAEGILPGERFDADQQCMLKYGKDSIRSRNQPFSDICRDLHCQRERYTWTSHPALEGTECGEVMWCRSGVCSMKATVMESYSATKQITNVAKQYDKVNFIEDKKLANLRHEYNFNKPPTWSEWSQPTACDSGCLYGPSGRLREGSTGLKIFTRNCLDYKRRCAGRDKKYESCVAKQCYTITKTTIEEFATQICERAKKFDNELTGIGLQYFGDSIEDPCKVYCETKSNGTKSRSWTFPDGTTCRTNKYNFDDTAYCINGRCEKFSCENSSTNYFKISSIFCPQNEINENNLNSEKKNDENANNRDFKSIRIKNLNKIENEKYFHGSSSNSNDNHGDGTSNMIRRKSDNYAQQWKQELVDLNVKQESEWIVKSGCHFSCMDGAKGIQVVTSKKDSSNNIQLCSPKVIPCDKLQTASEFAENICSRYKLKVRGLSGYGMQISPSVQDPDRSCRVACQDEFLPHRFYLVNGDYGLFPFGTKCSPKEERYCVNGKCLEFGLDELPLTQSYISLALYRNKRSIRNQGRFRRSYLYYMPVNITETITQEFIDSIIGNLNFHIRNNLHDPFISFDDNHHIEFTNPIHISTDDELKNYEN